MTRDHATSTGQTDRPAMARGTPWEHHRARNAGQPARRDQEMPLFSLLLAAVSVVAFFSTPLLAQNPPVDFHQHLLSPAVAQLIGQPTRSRPVISWAS